MFLHLCHSRRLYRQTPPPIQTLLPLTATGADGTHPNGILSWNNNEHTLQWSGCDMDWAIIMINMDYMCIWFTYTARTQQVTTHRDSNRHRQSETLYLTPSLRRWREVGGLGGLINRPFWMKLTDNNAEHNWHFILKNSSNHPLM